MPDDADEPAFYEMTTPELARSLGLDPSPVPRDLYRDPVPMENRMPSVLAMPFDQRARAHIPTDALPSPFGFMPECTRCMDAGWYVEDVKRKDEENVRRCSCPAGEAYGHLPPPR